MTKPTLVLKNGLPEGCPLGQVFRADTAFDQEVFDDIMLSRAKLLRSFPFWGFWVMNLVFVEDPTDAIGTALTDGRHIMYSPKFLRQIKIDHPGNYADVYDFIIAHEIYHNIGLHVSVTGWFRGKDADSEGDPVDQDLFGIACDYFINGDLIDGKIGSPPINGIDIYHDPAYRGWTVEDIYLDLKHKPRPIKNSFDTHMRVRGAKPGEEPGVKIAPDGTVELVLPEEEIDKIAEKLVQVTHQAQTTQNEYDLSSGKGVGSLPNGMKLILESLMKPKVNWKVALAKFVRSVKRRGYSPMRPNKNYFSRGITLPSFRKFKTEIDMVFIVDASGSMNKKELTAASSELHGILQQMGEFTVLAWTFDGVVQEKSVTKITRNGKNTLAMLTPFLKNFRGGGGTSFNCNWEWMKEKKIKPRVIVFFTDGGTNDGWGDPTYAPVLWMVTQKVSNRPGYGTYVEYEI